MRKITDKIVETRKIRWELIQELQPEHLKTDYHSQKTKDSIIKNGFARAIYVWHDSSTNIIYCIDGHLRIDLLHELKADGHDIPDELSCTFLDIKNKKEAINFLLSVFNPKTNPINKDSLDEWQLDDDFTLEEFELKDTDLNIEGADFDNNKSNQELDTEGDDSDNSIRECPNCGHQF